MSQPRSSLCGGRGGRRSRVLSRMTRYATDSQLHQAPSSWLTGRPAIRRVYVKPSFAAGRPQRSQARRWGCARSRLGFLKSCKPVRRRRSARLCSAAPLCPRLRCPPRVRSGPCGTACAAASATVANPSLRPRRHHSYRRRHARRALG